MPTGQAGDTGQVAPLPVMLERCPGLEPALVSLSVRDRALDTPPRRNPATQDPAQVNSNSHLESEKNNNACR